MPCVVDGRQVEPGGQLREAHPARALERGQDPDRAVDRLDHRDEPPVGMADESMPKTLAHAVNHGSNVRVTFDNTE